MKNPVITYPSEPSNFKHDYPFDPAHGYTLEDMLQILPPEEPKEFQDFWKSYYQKSLNVSTQPKLKKIEETSKYCIYSLEYTSAAGNTIKGWATTPLDGVIENGVVQSHGYSGQCYPEFDVPIKNAVTFYPGLRGLTPSFEDPIPSDAWGHVLYGIESKDSYIIGSCVADTWCCASALLECFPQIKDNLYYLGGSFGGGIGALALPWDKRFKKAELRVPTFGHHPTRLQLQCTGSGESVRNRFQEDPSIAETLAYFDAAIAAQYIEIPVIFGCALFDPSVPPAGQFSVYNAKPEPKELFILRGGHHEYEGQEAENQEYFAKQCAFFARP